jgi:WD40 repeat protein
VVFAPDGKRLSSAGFDGQIRYWEVPTLEIDQIIPAHENGANAIAFSPDGKLLATSERYPGQGLEAKLKVWEVATTKHLHSLEGARGRVLAIAFRPAGRLMATGGGIYRQFGELMLWDPIGGKRLWECQSLLSIDDLAFSPDGNTLITVGGVEVAEGEVQVWDVSGLIK